MEISNEKSSGFFFGDVVIGDVLVGDVVVGDVVIGDAVADFEVDMDDGDGECDDNFAVESLRIVVCTMIGAVD